jgi:hypothetical protein
VGSSSSSCLRMRLKLLWFRAWVFLVVMV